MSGAQYAAQILVLVLPVAVEQSQTLLPLRVEFFFQYYLQIFPKKAMGKPTSTQIGRDIHEWKGNTNHNHCAGIMIAEVESFAHFAATDCAKQCWQNKSGLATAYVLTG
jgi:hypothetical protein